MHRQPKKIIQTVHSHTLTVVLSALSLSASGMEAEELLYELQTCGLSISSSETVELYKDGDYADRLMAEHLKKLLQLGKLFDSCLNVLRNLSLLSASGVLKNAFKNWIKLPSLNNVIDSLISITENILLDIPENHLLFLQDMFPYLEKYLVTDYLPKPVERIEYVMKQDINVAPDKTSPQQSARSCYDRALLLDYKAELFLIKNDYKNALKKRLKAVGVLEPYYTEDTDQYADSHSKY